jgi:GTP-binding protein
VVLTKIDELKREEFARVVSAVESETRQHTAAFPDLFATSAHEKDGLDTVRVHLAALASP